MVQGFLKELTDFDGNCNLCEVLCFRLFWMFLCYGWALYRFCDLQGLHSSATVLGFLEVRLFLKVLTNFWETAVLVWFYVFDCYGYLLVKDG